MISSLEFNYISLMLFKNRGRYLSLMIISILIVFLLTSTLFISSSIKGALIKNLHNQPDFIVQRVRGGQSILAPNSWGDKILNINGVTNLNGRVYGRYFLDKEHSILIIGVDFFDEQTNLAIKSLVDSIDLKDFFKEDSMIVGRGVKEYFKNHFFNNNFTFITPSGKLKRVRVYRVLDNKSGLFSNDVAIVNKDLARDILGISKDSVSDFAITIPNDSEKATIKDKIEAMFYDVRVVTKEDMQRAYESLFDYKSGVFLTLFLILLSTFTLILYLRYSITTSIERKEIGVFRALGWSIRDVIKFKFLENISFVIFSYIVAVALAYIYVFKFNAPLLIDIFLDNQNLKNFVKLDMYIDFGLLFSIFMIFAISFLATTLIPIWRIATIEPTEVMK